MKRYFIIVYTASSKDNRSIYTSNMNIIVHDGTFPSRKVIIKSIEEKHPLEQLQPPLITNIMELSGNDWNDYNIE